MNYGRGEHGTASMNVQILVLPDGRLVRASAHYPGSMHDVATPDAFEQTFTATFMLYAFKTTL